VLLNSTTDDVSPFLCVVDKLRAFTILLTRQEFLEFRKDSPCNPLDMSSLSKLRDSIRVSPVVRFVVFIIVVEVGITAFFISRVLESNPRLLVVSIGVCLWFFVALILLGAIADTRLGQYTDVLIGFYSLAVVVAPIVVGVAFSGSPLHQGREEISHEGASMEPVGITFLVEVLAGLTVAGLSAATAYFYRGEKERKRVGEAPFVYVRRLDELIKRGAKEGRDNAIINARAIVAARNSLARSLVSISSSLNSEIDKLAEQIGEPRLIPGALPPGTERLNSFADAERAYDSIQVLARIWPSKRSQVVIEVRKILAELGLSFDAKHEDRLDDWWNNQSM
jgi:hypothetical protein